MSYQDTYIMSQSQSLIGRITVCAFLEDKLVSGMTATTQQWVQNNLLKIVSTTGWDVAWGASTSDDPGADGTVITDQMILSAVQAIQ